MPQFIAGNLLFGFEVKKENPRDDICNPTQYLSYGKQDALRDVQNRRDPIRNGGIIGKANGLGEYLSDHHSNDKRKQNGIYPSGKIPKNARRDVLDQNIDDDIQDDDSDQQIARRA